MNVPYGARTSSPECTVVDFMSSTRSQIRLPGVVPVPLPRGLDDRFEPLELGGPPQNTPGLRRAADERRRIASAPGGLSGGDGSAGDPPRSGEDLVYRKAVAVAQIERTTRLTRLEVP